MAVIPPIDRKPKTHFIQAGKPVHYPKLTDRQLSVLAAIRDDKLTTVERYHGFLQRVVKRYYIKRIDLSSSVRSLWKRRLVFWRKGKLTMTVAASHLLDEAGTPALYTETLEGKIYDRSLASNPRQGCESSS